MSNMYAAPHSDLAQENIHSDHQATHFFSWNGRIGRLRFLAYLLALSSGGMLIGGLSFGILIAVFAQRMPYLLKGQFAPMIGIAIVLLPLLAALLIFSRRRLHDLNLSAWFSLSWLAPFISMLPAALSGQLEANNEILGLTMLCLIPVFLYLTFAPGKAEANRFGDAPNSNNYTLLLCFLPLILLLVMAYIGNHRGKSVANKQGAISQPYKPV